MVTLCSLNINRNLSNNFNLFNNFNIFNDLNFFFNYLFHLNLYNHRNLNQFNHLVPLFLLAAINQILYWNLKKNNFLSTILMIIIVLSDFVRNSNFSIRIICLHRLFWTVLFLLFDLHILLLSVDILCNSLACLMRRKWSWAYLN
jgi:hypothetical protein